MEYHIRVYEAEKIYDYPLNGRERLCIGKGEADCILPYTEIQKEHMTFYKRNGSWFVQCADASVLNGEKEIKDGDVFVLNQEHRLAVYVFEKDMTVVHSVDIAGMEEIAIGRGEQCQVRLPENNISRIHAIIRKNAGGYELSDNNSLNGTFLNGNRIAEPCTLEEGDTIAVGTFYIQFSNQLLTISKEQEGQVRDVKETIAYPFYVKQAPRLRKELPKEVISITNPPQETAEPESDLFSMLASPVVMIVMLIIMAVVSAGTGGIALIITLPMSVLTIVMNLRMRKKQKKQYADKEENRVGKYGDYLDGIEGRAKVLQKKTADILCEDYPSAEECADGIRADSDTLWCCQPMDTDFLALRLGKGTIDAPFKVQGQQNGFQIQDDALLERAKALMNNYQTVPNVPVCCNLMENRLVGIVGERKNAVELAKSMLLQTAVHYSYQDVRIVTVYSKREEQEWRWLKWLPHCQNDEGQQRLIADNSVAADNLLQMLEELLKQRNQTAGKDVQPLPVYLFVFTELELAAQHTIMKYILQKDVNLGIAALFLYDEMRLLPKECQSIINVDNGRGALFERDNADKRQEFVLDLGQRLDYDKAARALAPMRVKEMGGEASLPGMITFLEGYGVKRPQEIPVERNWTTSYTNQSMAVPIGVKGDGKPFYFDIHEKKYGPHGMVAGMTGSGKSEMVQSWILSMALQFSPQDVSFVLIDFKGTGLILPFLNLPHLAGTISDLDNKIGRNLVALENELSRRKELLDSYGVNNINSYLKLYQAGKAPEPMPFLFIIIDEFAEFKVQFPDFMTVVDRIFAIGRTLGVFAILLTQKPAGVVDDKMNANTRFRWCLKVASSADSKEMLHHADAAKITNPGRAYVQVGEDEVYELIQSYYSGAAFDPEREKGASLDDKLAVVEENGRRVYYENEVVSNALSGDTTEISEIVTFLKQHTEETGRETAKKIWLPKLPFEMVLQDIQKDTYADGAWSSENKDDRLLAVAGMVDNPAGQTQYPLQLDFTADGHMAVFGAPGTGKTTFLHTTIMSMLMRYSPEQLNLYMMDFGGWSLGIFKNFPHVGGIANDNDEEKIEKLVQLLERKLSERKEKFSDIGVGSLAAYQEATGEKLPFIVLALDNFAPVLQLYPQLDTFFIRLTREGGNYGIYLLASANNPMALGFKINQNIKMALALQMTDKSDYQGIVGKTGGLEPESAEGRGLVKGNPPLEFQTAYPAPGQSESERVSYIKQLAEQMRMNWKGEMAAPIPIMPREIPYGSYSSDKMLLGLSSKWMEPVALPKQRKHFMPILGTFGAGKTNMLLLLARQSLEKEQAKITFVSLDGNQPAWAEDANCQWIQSGAGLDEQMADLVPLLQERKNEHDADASAVFSPIYIFIDDFKKVYEQIEDKTAKRLEAVLRLGEGLNVNLYISSDAEEFGRFHVQGEPICMLMARENTGILIGGSLSSYHMFQSDVTGAERNTAVGLYEGYFLNRGETVRMKAMCAEEK